MPLPRPVAGLTLSSASTRRDRSAGRPSAVILGGGHAGRSLAVSLRDDYDVAFASRRAEVAGRAERDGLDAHHVEEIDASALQRVGADDAALAVVATGDDGANLLAAQLLSTTFDVADVVVRVNDREKLDSFGDLDAATVCVPDLLADEVTDCLEAAADDSLPR